MKHKFIAVLLMPLALPALLTSQSSMAGKHLDPAYNPQLLHPNEHEPLPEEYIWTAGDAAALRPDHSRFTYRDQQRKIEPHAFRSRFDVQKLPTHATLFIAGPRSAKVYLNGVMVMDSAVDPASPIHEHVFRAELRSELRIGKNILAIEAVRGMGIVAASDSALIQQLAFGEALAVKIEDERAEKSAAPLLISNQQWRSIVAPAEGWQQPEFDDSAWPLVQSLGSIESRPEFFQWNLDAGLYDWPDYMGMSPELRTYRLLPTAITHRHPADGSILYPEALQTASPTAWMTVGLSQLSLPAEHAPGFLLDFGREVSGRLLVRSACDCTAQIMVSYGESESEALNRGHYLGENLLTIPAHGVARGPKSGFRYAWIHFVGGAPVIRLRAIEVEAIAYPVTYVGSFASSDARLNMIWETAAYTAHLCMQDGVWDAPKRDRGWWAGDLDVSEPVTSEVFGDTRPIKQTLAHLLPPEGEHVNGIPSYTALWITTLADTYRHDEQLHDLQAHHADLLRLLAQMDAEFDATYKFLNRQHRWLFVDWSERLFGSTEEAAQGTAMQLLRGYHEGAWLLREIGDEEHARVYAQKAEALRKHTRRQVEESKDPYFASPQLGALAILTDVAGAQEYSQIWNSLLGHLGKTREKSPVISPYFNAYVLQSMTRMGHRQEALNWLRTYWGGMIDEGATSFWEAYDLGWPKSDPHTALQADGRTGYFASLAHGWSSAPASWLLEEILGVHATQPGYSKIVVRPDLLDLQWAHGSIATPQGAVGVAVRRSPRISIELMLPARIEATVLLPVRHPEEKVLVNGVLVTSTPAENGARASIVLRRAGRYTITSR
jgi:hypothetical protein